MSPDENPLRRVLLLRHGVTDWNEQRRWQGRTDVPLNPRGLQQAHRVAAELARDSSIAVIGYSTARRAAQTALVLKGALDLAGRPAVMLPREDLVEIDVGVWAGLPQSEVAQRWPEAAARVGHDGELTYGETGETLAEVSRRARAALAELTVTLEPGRTLVVVTHGAVISALTASMLGWGSAGVGEVLSSVGNCRWAELTGDGDRWVLDRWNAGP